MDQLLNSDIIPKNLDEIYNLLIKDLFGWEISKEVNILANTSHFIGYACKYYVYFWSKAYVVDLFTFFKSNDMNLMGKKLREEILSKGGTLDGIDLMRNFMNRKPNPDAFIEWIINK